MNNSTLVKNRLYYANSRGKLPTDAFNCWGATTFVLGVHDRLQWIEREDMEEILLDNTVKIHNHKRTRGDILALWCDGYLIHTAVYLGRNKFFHKKGMNNSEITDMGTICELYYEADEFSYRRLKKM